MKGALLVLLSAVLLLGCDDAKQPSSKSAGSETKVATAPVDYLNTVGQAQRKAVKTIDLVALNKAVEAFYVQEGRFPRTLEELEEKGFVRAVPLPPPGLKLNYDANAGVVTVSKSPEASDDSLAPAK